MSTDRATRRSFIRNASGLTLLAAAGVPALACAVERDGADARPRPADGGEAGDSEAPTPFQGTRSALSVPGPMLPPVPAVLLTVNGLPGDPDEISVVWSFVLNGEPAQIGISVGDEHVAGPAIGHHGEFVLNVPLARSIVAFDTVDMNSSRVGDKYELSGFTRGQASAVAAPTVEESPLHLECRVTHTVPLPPVRRSTGTAIRRSSRRGFRGPWESRWGQTRCSSATVSRIPSRGPSRRERSRRSPGAIFSTVRTASRSRPMATCTW